MVGLVLVLYQLSLGLVVGLVAGSLRKVCKKGSCVRTGWQHGAALVGLLTAGR